MNFILLFILFYLTFPHLAEATPADEVVRECVGHVRIDFPSAVDIAANTADMLMKELKVGSIQPHFEFSDGENAGWTLLDYGGVVYASHSLNKDQQNKIMISQVQRLLDAKKSANKRKENESFFEKIDVHPAIGAAARVGNAFSALIFIDGHLIWRESSVYENEISHFKKNVFAFIENVSARPVGVVPKSEGLCFPYFFLDLKGDTRLDKRHISSTYRLKKNPDITVWLEDSEAGNSPDKKTEKANQPTNQINEFWSQYGFLRDVTNIESEWSFPAGRKVKIDGRQGVASFVKITRKSGAVDYGYLAIVRGDEKLKENASDIRFYVIRNSEKSLRKGVEPLSQDKFIKLAEDMLSTIKSQSRTPSESAR